MGIKGSIKLGDKKCVCGSDTFKSIEQFNIGSPRKRKMVQTYVCKECEARYMEKRLKKAGKLKWILITIDEKGRVELELIKIYEVKKDAISSNKQ